MKNRKVRQNQPRRVVVPQEETSTILSHLKQPSSHTKITTTGTFHLTGSQPTSEKKGKNKKNSKNISKGSNSEFTPINSKSRRKPALVIPLREQPANFSQAQESFREYCLVEDSFLPITDYKQQQLLDEMFAQTAASSCDINGFGLGNKQISRAKPSRLRRKSISSSQSNISPKQEKEKISSCEIGVETTKREKQMTCAEVEAVTEKCEIGMQYSQRKTFTEEVQHEKDIKPEIEIQVQPIVEENNETLSDLLFKLEFTHLGNEKSFTFLSSEEKQHFSQLLQTVICKLTSQNYKPQLKPISFQQLDDSPSKNQEDCMTLPKQNSPRRKPENVELQLLNQKMEQLLCLRQYQQLSLIQDSCQYDNETKVNTTLVSIMNFLAHLFCYIEVNYSQEFVYMIRKMYGYSFREKYRRITRGISLVPEKRFRVIDQSLFEDFVNENVSSQGNCNYNEVLHLKAIFDAFNQHLEQYRPYYLGNGQQFPWAFKMFITMSQYSIDQDSLQIIFKQAKDKIGEWATLLCGILVESDQKIISTPKNPIQMKRLEGENKMIANWITEQNFEKDGVELFGTQSLHETSQEIYLYLIEEFIHEADFFFY